MQRSILTLLAALVLAGVLGTGARAWYVFSGTYNIAATEPHFGIVRSALDRVFHASVRRQAENIALETGKNDAANGMKVYAENCARCHSAPGGEIPPWVRGLRPMPPQLPAEGTEFDLSEIYWLVRHGARMTAMPGWHDVLTDEEIRAVAAMVDEMPGIAVERYQQVLEDDDQPAAAVTVKMTSDLKFAPETITISAGETVRWVNTSGFPHTATADIEKASNPDHVVLPEGAEPFDSGLMQPEEEYSHRFDVSGRYRYFCIPHEGAGMIGEIIVEK